MLITLDVGDFMLLAAIIPLGIAALLTLCGVTVYCCCWKGKFISSGSVSEPSSSSVTTSSSNNSSNNRSSFGNTMLQTTSSSSSNEDERRVSSIPGRTFNSSDQGYSSEDQPQPTRGVSLSSMVEEEDDVFFNNVIPNQRRYSMPGHHHEDETFFRQVLPQHRRNSSPGSRPRRFTANSVSSMSSHRGMLQHHRSHSHFNSVSQSGRSSHHNSQSHVSTRSMVPGVHNQQGGCFRTPVQQQQHPGSSNRRVSLPSQHHLCTPSSSSHIRSSMPAMFMTPGHRGHDTVAPYMVVPCTSQATPAPGGGRSRTPWTPNQHLTKWLDDHIANA